MFIKAEMFYSKYRFKILYAIVFLLFCSVILISFNKGGNLKAAASLYDVISVEAYDAVGDVDLADAISKGDNEYINNWFNQYLDNFIGMHDGIELTEDQRNAIISEFARQISILIENDDFEFNADGTLSGDSLSILSNIIAQAITNITGNTEVNDWEGMSKDDLDNIAENNSSLEAIRTQIIELEEKLGIADENYAGIADLIQEIKGDGGAEKSIAELTIELSKLQTVVNNYENSEVLETVNNYNTQINEINKIIESIQKEETADNKDLQTQLESLKNQLDSIYTSEDIDKEVTSISKDLEEKEGQIININENITNILNTMETSNSNLKDSVESVKSSAEASISQVSSKLESVNNTINETIKNNTNEYLTWKSEMLKTVQTINSNIASVQSGTSEKITALSNSIAQQISKLNTDSSSFDTKIKNNLEALGTRLDAADLQLKTDLTSQLNSEKEARNEADTSIIARITNFIQDIFNPFKAKTEDDIDTTNERIIENYTNIQKSDIWEGPIEITSDMWTDVGDEGNYRGWYVADLLHESITSVSTISINYHEGTEFYPQYVQSAGVLHIYSQTIPSTIIIDSIRIENEIAPEHGSDSELDDSNSLENGNHVHEYVDSIIKEPTCTETGTLARTCGCGLNELIELPTRHTYDEGGTVCTQCGYIRAGLYDADGNVLADWEDLILDYGWDVESDVASIMSTEAPFAIIKANFPSTTKIVIDSSVSHIGKNAFYGLSNLVEVVVQSPIDSFGDSAFGACNEALTVKDKEGNEITIEDRVKAVLPSEIGNEGNNNEENTNKEETTNNEENKNVNENPDPETTQSQGAGSEG